MTRVRRSSLVMTVAGALAIATLQAAAKPLPAATASARFDATTHVFRLDGGNVTYAFGVNAQGVLQSVYWGARLEPTDLLSRPKAMGRPFELDDTPQEFAGWGGGLLAEPSLKVTFPDGNRDLVLHYVSHTTDGSKLDVVLRDIDRDYGEFNEERTAFYKQQGLEPLPASTGIQAKLCRPELLVEGEAIAIFRNRNAEPAA